MTQLRLVLTDTSLPISGAIHSASLGSVSQWTKSASRRDGKKQQEDCGGVSGRSAQKSATSVALVRMEAGLARRVDVGLDGAGVVSNLPPLVSWACERGSDARENHRTCLQRGLLPQLDCHGALARSSTHDAMT